VEAVIFVGIQATGKSSFYKARFFKTHIRINLDMLKTRHREDILLRACIQAKQPFVVDNTNATVEGRAKYIRLAKAAGFRIVGYYFQSRIDDAIRRNANRPEAERIPAKGIWAAYRRLQLPSLDEGFDALYYVQIREPQDFVVQEWTGIAGRSEVDGNTG
jgi:predicted kinase